MGEFPPGAVEAEMDRLEAAEGTQLLEDVAHMVRRYVMAGPEQIDTITLWIVHTHAIEAFYTTGRLYITSPEANCGKSVALSVIGSLAANPLTMSSISAAGLYRSMETETPTFLIDEVDKTLNGKASKDSEGNQLLGAILNSGYRRGQVVIRCVGPKSVATKFPTFAPVALAGISGGGDQTFLTRAIPIILQRWVGQEELEELELSFEVAEEFALLAERIARWARMWTIEIRKSKPERPAGLVGRNAELWMPLIQVAAVGGWLERAHAACEAITLFEAPGANTPAWELLRDLQRCVDTDEEFVATSVLIERLHELPDADWRGFNFGRGMNPKSVAKLLGQYGIAPKVVRRGEETRRGYVIAGKVQQAWIIYVDPVENSNALKDIEDEMSLFSTPPLMQHPQQSRDIANSPVTRNGSTPEVTGEVPVTESAAPVAPEEPYATLKEEPATPEAKSVTPDEWPDVEPF